MADPVPLTREMVEILRSEAHTIEDPIGSADSAELYLTMAQRRARMEAIADAIESHLGK